MKGNKVNIQSKQAPKYAKSLNVYELEQFLQEMQLGHI